MQEEINLTFSSHDAFPQDLNRQDLLHDFPHSCQQSFEGTERVGRSLGSGGRQGRNEVLDRKDSGLPAQPSKPVTLLDRTQA